MWLVVKFLQCHHVFCDWLPGLCWACLTGSHCTASSSHPRTLHGKRRHSIKNRLIVTWSIFLFRNQVPSPRPQIQQILCYPQLTENNNQDFVLGTLLPLHSSVLISLFIPYLSFFILQFFNCSMQSVPKFVFPLLDPWNYWSLNKDLAPLTSLQTVHYAIV